MGGQSSNALKLGFARDERKADTPIQQPLLRRWYLTVGAIGGTAGARFFSGTWWSYTGEQALTGAWRQNKRSNSNVAPLTITFSGPDTARMTLPNGRTTNLRRHRF